MKAKNGLAVFALVAMALAFGGSRAAFAVNCVDVGVATVPCDFTRATYTVLASAACRMAEDFEFVGSDDETRVGNARKDSSCRSKADDSDHVGCWAAVQGTPATTTGGGCAHHNLKRCAMAASHHRKLPKWCISNPPPTLTGADFYIYCRDVYDNCYATYANDATALAACNNDANTGWPALLADYDTANTVGSASCTATRCGVNDWCCGMSATTGYPLPNDGNCTGGLRKAPLQKN